MDLETIKLYYDDPYVKDFEAVVMNCIPEGRNYLIKLNRTAFYPEGGGQPCDLGRLGSEPVLDVQERDGIIYHTVAHSLTVGAPVEGHIDWERRFDHMQQHSGEHIISGLLCRTYGCDNVGFHMGADTVTIDYNINIPWEGALEVERQANRYIMENHAVEIRWPSMDDLPFMVYRSKKDLTGQPVRIVEFPGADRCACCGTHVSASAEVGLVKLIGMQHLRGGVRLELLCGRRALAYLSMNWQQNSAIGRELSVKADGTHAAVLRLKEEAAALKLRCDTLETESFAAQAAQYADAGDVLLIRPAMEPDAVRRLCDTVAQQCGGRCALFAGEAGAYKYAVIHPGTDIRPLIKDMNAALNGRGGGRDGFAQGSAACREEAIRTFFGGLS